MFKPFYRPMAIILAAIIVASIFCGILVYKNSKSNEINENESEGEALPSVSTQKDGERPICLLIIGRDKVSSLADVIMLVSFDKASKKSCVLQLPRDTYADYGQDHFKINGALKALGEAGMCDFLEESMGIEIDGYISLELAGFRALVDAIGGVELDVDKHLKYSDPTQGLYIDLPAGRQTLNGKQAEMLVRYRSGYARGDLDRLDIQKRFLAAFFLRLKDKVTPLNIYSLANKILPHLKTNIPVGELISLGLSATAVKSKDIRIATAPGEDAVSSISGASFYILSAPSMAELLEKYFCADADSFDKNMRFLHPSLDSFAQIYRKKIENKVFSADELK